jgi:hypothetical protein
MPVSKFADPKADNIRITVTLLIDDVMLINKFISINQHNKNTHGPMSLDKLVTMWLEDVAAAVKDNTTWRGGHAALVLGEHGYYTGSELL